MSARLTEIDAVNEILSSLGHRKVNSIEGNTSQYTRNAASQLNTANRTIQLVGWSFNTVPEYTLSVNAETGEIPVPGTLVEFNVPHQRQYQLRGDRLYDRQKQTYVFRTALTGKAKFILDWNDLPEAAKEYITKQAARMAYEKYVGSDETRATLYQEEQAAKFELINYDAAGNDYTMLDSYSQPRLRGSQYIPGTIPNNPNL